MLKELLGYFRGLLFIVRDLEETKTETKRLRQELEEWTDTVRLMVFEIRQVASDDRHEREKLMLRLENELLRFERRLPRSPDDRP